MARTSRHQIKTTLVAMFLTSAAASIALAQDFPLLQDGGARTAFVSSFIKSCVAAGQGDVSFCTCYARGVADQVTGQEAHALVAAAHLGVTDSQALNSLLEKEAIAASICRQ